ncbi:AbiH family protein [Paludibacter sp.]|uniref:AbiH family protein n=1 Tax=Paludibacter sp. TaxID=1898105 RepID=UPI001353B6D9|nr:AbiH family protein [Paludibacter sp.]MTK53378.1 hypothetical protein [Paludibacter sp.]
MEVLFLIGNGCDLNVGLKTRFKDVLEAYLKRKDTDPRLCKFKEDINLDLEDWSDFEKQMGVYTEKFTIDTIDDYYFCIKNFREFLVLHLKNQESHIDYQQSEDDIISVFRYSMQKFQNELQPLDLTIRSPILNISETIQYNFITFNYTSVLDNCLSILKEKFSLSRLNYIDSISQILHLHGTTEEDLIMGVDNVSQITNENIATDKKLQRTIIKPVINDKRKNLNNRIGESLIMKSRLICIFGLSLGATDQRWWHIVGEWLEGHDQRRLLLFVKENEWNLVHPEDSIEKNEEVLEKAFNAMNISQTDSISDRIHIGFNTKMFKIDLTKKDKEASLHTSLQVESSSFVMNQN